MKYMLTTECFFQRNNRLQKEAEQRGEKFKISKLRRNLQMDEYDLLHWKRSLEEREALFRDISWYSFCLSFSLIKKLV